jgi:hypothetical protein
MNRVRFIEYLGNRIILLDFAGITNRDVSLAAVSEARRFVGTQPPDGSSLLLTDARNTIYDRHVVDALTQMAAANRPFVKAAAVVSDSAIHHAAIAMVAFLRAEGSTCSTRASTRSTG